MADLMECLRKGGLVEDVARILESGSDVNRVDEDGWTALHRCVVYDSDIDTAQGVEVMKLLMAQGADVNATNKGSTTPLMFFIACNCNSDLIIPLLEKGTNANITDGWGQNALHLYALFYRSEDKNLNVLKKLIELHPDLNVKDEKGITPLMRSILNGNSKQCIDALIAGGSDINAKDNEGDTILHMYAWGYKNMNKDRLVILETLAEHGALVNINAENNKKVTPLMYFVQRALPVDFIEFLIKRGANVCDVYDNAGNGILYYFLSGLPHGDSKTLSFLLENGADPNKKNEDGEPPILAALERKRKNAAGEIKILFEYGCKPDWNELGLRIVSGYVQEINRNDNNGPPDINKYQLIFKHVLLENEDSFEPYLRSDRPEYVELASCVDTLKRRIHRARGQNAKSRGPGLFRCIAVTRIFSLLYRNSVGKLCRPPTR